MDRRRARLKQLILAGVAVGLSACAVAPPEPSPTPPDFSALNWLRLDADPVGHMTRQPSTCLSAPKAAPIQRGALLFESPMLLGGQAAKAGLSCAACHRNGRGNPDFLFQGISGAPGTADVTHGLFSKVRADQVFNPVAIPDLATVDGQSRVDRDSPGTLEAFLNAQIVEEFSGTQPDPVVIEDLAAYLRALDIAVCNPSATEPQSWRQEVARIKAGLSTRGAASQSYINAMRAAVGRIYERLSDTRHSELRRRLIRFSRALEAGNSMDELRLTLSDIEQDLAAAESTSFYNPDVLATVWP
ncbi:MAG: hypothetical protein AAF437_07685 [Pseudomonadota bacterium]